MSDEKKQIERRQKLRKYAVFAAMFLVFTACMWLIFVPSGADREKEKLGSGFNADIPDPKKGEIIGDKRDAYERDQAKLKQQDRMRSLEAFMTDAGKPAADSDASMLQLPDETDGEDANDRNTNSIRSSNAAYKDINRTLGSFYEKPKDDPEKQELQKKLAELEGRLEETENRKASMDEQLALMEKSYQMAARYMPSQNGYPENQQEGLSAEQMKNKIVKSSGTAKKPKVSPVRQVTQAVVTALGQRMSDEEMMDRYDQERNYGFYSMDKISDNNHKNTIAACIHDDQKVTDGQSLRMRLTEPLIAGATLIPENTILTGQAKVQGERMEINISSIEYEGEIIAVELTVYDSDGQRGINIPGSMEQSAAKEIAANMGSNLGSSINITQQSAGQLLLSDMGRGLIQGTSGYLGRKLRTVTVTLKSGYKLMLLPKDS